MNKVLNINLGGYPFTIDEDAYDHLNQYLETIHQHFRQSEGYEEITQDIEARLAELFQESLGSRPIVTVKDVRDAIIIMGTPEDFGAEPLEEASGSGDAGSGFKTGKRLFRDAENKTFGGVCSGIAAYLGIADPLWVRLAFVLFTLSGGFGIPLYLILWAIVPQAESASDRLAMRGEPINVSNIGRIIEEELQRFSNTVSEFGEEISSKKNFSAAGDERNPLARGIAFVSYLLNQAFSLIAQIWRPIMLIVIFALTVAFAVSVISSILGVVFGMPYLNYLSPDENALTVLGTINLLFLIGIPVLMIILFLSRLLLGTRINPAWSTGLVILMIANAISLGLLGSFLGRQFSAATESSRIQELTLGDDDTLQLQLGSDALASPWINIDNKVRLNDQELALQHVDLRITRAEDDQFHLTQKVYTRGRDQAEATGLAGNLHYQVSQDGNMLTIPPDIILKRGEKWRAQEVTLVLEVPRGRSVLMHQNIHRILSSIDLEDRKVTPWAHPGKVWRMETEGLRCLDCSGEGEEMLSVR